RWRQMASNFSKVEMNLTVCRRPTGKAGSDLISLLSVALDVKQRIGALRATPRGLKRTMSNLARIFGDQKAVAAPRTKSTPEPPGPPGFTNSEPIRCAGSVGGSLIGAMPMVAPRGCA